MIESHFSLDSGRGLTFFLIGVVLLGSFVLLALIFAPLYFCSRSCYGSDVRFLYQLILVSASHHPASSISCEHVHVCSSAYLCFDLVPHSTKCFLHFLIHQIKHIEKLVDSPKVSWTISMLEWDAYVEEEWGPEGRQALKFSVLYFAIRAVVALVLAVIVFGTSAPA